MRLLVVALSILLTVVIGASNASAQFSNSLICEPSSIVSLSKDGTLVPDAPDTVFWSYYRFRFDLQSGRMTYENGATEQWELVQEGGSQFDAVYVLLPNGLNNAVRDFLRLTTRDNETVFFMVALTQIITGKCSVQ